MKKHIHCDIIKAFAKGERVQVLNLSGNWKGVTDPAFNPDLTYRIVPDCEAKHVHHYAMLAWADGHEIQCLLSEGTPKEVWRDTPSPTFAAYLNYRVKPAVSEKVALMEEMEELLERMKKLEKQYDEAFAL